MLLSLMFKQVCVCYMGCAHCTVIQFAVLCPPYSMPAADWKGILEVCPFHVSPDLTGISMGYMSILAPGS